MKEHCLEVESPVLSTKKETPEHRHQAAGCVISINMIIILMRPAWRFSGAAERESGVLP